MIHLDLARRLFPCEHWFRSGVADYYADVRWIGSRDPGIDAIRAALSDDPNNAGLHRNLAGLLIEAGDLPEAQRELDIVRRLVPFGTIPVYVNVNPETRTP